MCAVAALLLGGCADSAAPLGAGRYCTRSELVGHTGQGATIPLGTFWMGVDVETRDGRTYVGFANQMPDSGEILTTEPVEASTLPDGTLRFEFTDGWGHLGEGRLSPSGVITLTVLRRNPEGDPNIMRNYGSHQVSRAECAGVPRPLS